LDLFSTLGEMSFALHAAPLLALVIGLVFGITIGALPGMGPLLGVVLAIPFTFYMDPVSSLALLIGIYQGGNYGGAVTAAMLGIPGTPMASATLLDAYPMAVRGQASEAVSLALIASFFGGVFSAVTLILIAPALALFALRFGPPETFALALLGLTAIATLSQGSTLKGLLSGLLGLILVTIGSDPITGFQRFNYGRTELGGGVTLVAMMMGIFAVSELLVQLERPARVWQATGRIGPSYKMFRTIGSRFVNYIRSSITGVAIGIIPGVGGVTSAFLSYKLAKDFSGRPDAFGKGEPDGVIASEAANSATTGGALIPMLAIGIPGDPVTAAMMGGLLIQGLTPGPRLFTTNVEVIHGIFGAFLVGSLLLLPIGLASISLFVRLLKVPFSALLAAVLVLCTIGTFLVQRATLDLWQLWFFGALGYGMRKAKIPLSPCVIGFVLGPIFEVNLRRTTMLTGDDTLGYLAGRPITLVILVLVILSLLFPALQAYYANRQRR
jgi:putative tricarboxylic transport membrane protein